MNFWKNKKVVITGGAGFIGHHLMKRLIKEEVAELEIVDNFERGSYSRLRKYVDDYYRQDNVKTKLYWDDIDLTMHGLSDKECLERTFRDVDVVFHLAAKVGSYKFYKENASLVVNSNILIDANVIDAVVREKVPYFFYASTAHVYNDISGDWQSYSEAASKGVKVDKVDLSYTWAKIAGEKLLDYNKDNFKRIVKGRLNGIYGPGQDYDLENGSVIPVMARRIINHPNEEVKLLTNGEETRCYCYIDDAVEMMLQTVENNRVIQKWGCQSTDYDVFNIGNTDPISVRKISEILLDISGKEVILEVTGQEAEVKSQLVDCGRIHSIFQYKSKVSMEEGLRKVYEDVKKRIKKV